MLLAAGQDPEHGEGVGHLYRIDVTKKGDVSPVTPDNQPNPNSAQIWHWGGADTDGSVTGKQGRRPLPPDAVDRRGPQRAGLCRRLERPHPLPGFRDRQAVLGGGRVGRRLGFAHGRRWQGVPRQRRRGPDGVRRRQEAEEAEGDRIRSRRSTARRRSPTAKMFVVRPFAAVRVLDAIALDAGRRPHVCLAFHPPQPRVPLADALRRGVGRRSGHGGADRGPAGGRQRPRQSAAADGGTSWPHRPGARRRPLLPDPAGGGIGGGRRLPAVLRPGCAGHPAAARHRGDGGTPAARPRRPGDARRLRSPVLGAGPAAGPTQPPAGCRRGGAQRPAGGGTWGPSRRRTRPAAAQGEPGSRGQPARPEDRSDPQPGRAARRRRDPRGRPGPVRPAGQPSCAAQRLRGHRDAAGGTRSGRQDQCAARRG